VVPGEVVARIGAGRAVKLIELFYATVLRQPELQIYFDGTRTAGVPVDVDELRNHFLQFVVVAFGGGAVYKDMPLRQALSHAHKKLNVSRAHYRLTIGIFVTAMHAVRPAIDEATVRAVIAGIRPFESFVVSDGEPSEDDDET
jgi:truncated hemoglobin YjbI